MKYRKLTEITNEEVTELFIVLFDDAHICSINREAKQNIVIVEMTMNWGVDPITDEIVLEDDSIYTSDFAIEQRPYLQFLLAKGFNHLWKDNMFVKEDD